MKQTQISYALLMTLLTIALYYTAPIKCFVWIVITMTGYISYKYMGEYLKNKVDTK